MEVLVYLVQVARAILENPQDKTKVSLIYANVKYEDILLKVHIFRQKSVCGTRVAS
jgi:NAD(P)H-flavin reductase